MKPARPLARTHLTGGYRFTDGEAKVVDSEPGKPTAILMVSGPTADWHHVRAAALRIAANAEERLHGVDCSPLRVDATDRGAATIRGDCDTPDKARLQCAALYTAWLMHCEK